MFSLLNRILSKDNLRRAYDRVVGNRGSSGVDGVGVDDLAGYLREHWSRIEAEIRAGTYRPAAVRGVEIPKPNGGTRLLGIPTTTDRFIQQAIHQVLSPIFDKDFSPFSYGFRPGRSAHQALRQAKRNINEGFQDIIDLDLKSFFDEVNHSLLLKLLKHKVKDPVLLKLIRSFLSSGLLLGGLGSQRDKGTPQGGPLSPLLSNILLDELDKELAQRGHRFIRYADDCSIFLQSKRAAHRVLRSITRFIEEELRLLVNKDKTTICRPVRFELLGYGFISSYRKGAKGKYNLRVAPKSWKRLKLKIKALTRKTSPIPFEERIQRLNSLMYGWLGYFQLGKMWGKLRALDGWIRNRLRYCIWKQWKKPNRRMRAFRQLGIEAGMAYAWSRSRMGGWAIAQSPIMGLTVTKERLDKRGYKSFLDYYEQLFHGSRTA
ncbi:group II intron reverse transcriptase/maturase [Phaeodactylibacter xiamenensis]|uniref:group II intron reverse transcriptase/maturase n=1 Tax=Phaeodactylibacter xiamenensis TaxID=1524460 RepID=UPI0024AA006C|nr:group II intron reverse transcriptase/maturase [Phaeodactylibacter xiamenensis]